MFPHDNSERNVLSCGLSDVFCIAILPGRSVWLWRPEGLGDIVSLIPPDLYHNSQNRPLMETVSQSPSQP